jgi:2-polyprenyl-3-methyl-5-hydroxy-6-metoxy-1,4-benzoquinol methylase
MNVDEFLALATSDDRWRDVTRLPWHDEAFSRRMLREHLSQAHDGASRRFATIDRQVAWIHDQVLRRRPSRVLDLECGPGLYTERLAALGHACTGIDIGRRRSRMHGNTRAHARTMFSVT